MPLQSSQMARPSDSSSHLTLIIFLIFLPGFQLSIGLKPETTALLEFKKQLIDPLNYLESWRDSESPCGFYGVTCDPGSGLVTEISLDGKSLSGGISSSLSQLHNLTSLVMPSNNLSGILPSDLRKCTNLKVLNFSDNYLNGSIPDMSNLSNLEVLDLSDNNLSGEFPGWVGNLTRLVYLGLGDNNFDKGGIPESLANLKNLYWLYLANSNLKGEIPESISELKELGTLDMCLNKLSGDFPKWIIKLKKLFKIELYGNNLAGEIPPGLADLTLLQEFDISGNQMHGTIPNGIGDLKQLTVFQLYKNNFSGEIPAGFGSMEHLIALSVYGNRFTGEIPQNLGRFSPLSSIDISENKFSGPFPKYLCQNRNLINLLALDNNFSGGFPETYAECRSLQRLRVSKNHLNGVIPDGVWALPDVQVMDFSDNEFTGGVSPGLGESLRLNELTLSNNKFSGELPKEIGKLAQMQKIYLDNNSFSGRIPSEIGALKQITSLHLEGNAFVGSIPSELADCKNLVDLNLASNSLSGGIPARFSEMTSLNSLNLSRNHLTGSIPGNYDKLRLSLVDLSNNFLSGRVPPYFLRVAGHEALVGNNGLCIDDNGSRRQLINSGLRICDAKSDGKSFMKGKVALFSVIMVALVVVLGGLLFVSYRSFKQTHEVTQNPGGGKGLDANWKLESFQKVEFDAEEICDLPEDNLIGSGSTGKVYRLDLKKGCGTVAVKQLWKGNTVKLMAAEMDILGKIRHRNIVKLYACLIKEGSNFLILEYMANGNLYQALHREIKVGKPELDWYQRHKIALGAAKGIAYLHHDCSPPIIHRDIKSTNILLDEDYEAKIADFGVARVADLVSPGGSDMSSFSFAGTHGYIAPEMAYSLKLTEKSDVYSFGVVLLELVTGRRPIEDGYGEGKDIVYWVSTHLNSRESVAKVLDPKVVPELVEESMIKVLRIATLCTTKLPNLRPSMKEVVKMLTDAEAETEHCCNNSKEDGKPPSPSAMLINSSLHDV
ncbi:receptor protein-tyrosine kinase CEPR2-like [Andrographis paniculata]|uniref:receptor protein-tyrosine kinase CEPR2-like n=1 Tax=Andrographis paniculata TaxID=175694 RepID=UPI0021E92A2E|nr:receptor protein-tyrosine kinase CEPR2-like [Andrographis paniculata]